MALYKCGHCGFEGQCYGRAYIGDKIGVSSCWCSKCQRNDKPFLFDLPEDSHDNPHTGEHTKALEDLINAKGGDIDLTPGSFWYEAEKFANYHAKPLLGQLQKYKEALSYYSHGFIAYQGPGGVNDEPVWMPKPEIMDDGGQIARIALGEIDG